MTDDNPKLAWSGDRSKWRDDRPSLVFIHGAGGSGTFWKWQQEGLSDQANIVCVDLAGHGYSPGPVPDRITAHAHKVAELLRELEPPNQILAGISMGGAVVQQVLVDYPGLASAAILVATGAKLRVLPTIFEAIQGDFARYVELVGQTAAAPGADPKTYHHVLEDMRACGPSVVTADFRACDAFDLRERIGQIQVPVLVICGAQDVLTPPKYSDWLVENLPDAQLVRISGAGHFVALERAGEVNRAIGEFIGRL